MTALDYDRMIVPSNDFLSLSLDEGRHAPGDGVRYSARTGGNERESSSSHEMVRLCDDAYLMLTDLVRTEDAYFTDSTMTVHDDDWVQIHMMVNCGGYEEVHGRERVTLAERSCLVARYPGGSAVTHRLKPTEAWKFACIHLKTSAFAGLLDIDESMLPEATSWLTSSAPSGRRFESLPIGPALMAPISDLFACDFRGPMRRSYMRAKSIELLSTLVHILNEAGDRSGGSRIRLSASDLDRLSIVRAMLEADLESPLGLGALARHVGLSRTKLAVGFKATYGDTVEAYRRDARLMRGRELLRTEGASVTEAAFSVGYLETASFSRAFMRKFGVTPKACKPQF